MDCLNCGKQMVDYTVLTGQKQLSYDVCEGCGSLWLDSGELDKMASQVEGSIEFSSGEEVESEAATGRGCPRCRGLELEKVRFLGESDIVLDRCGNCGGFWLDGGDLDLINQELESIMPIEGKGFSEFVNNVHLPYWYKRIRRPSTETDFQVDVPPIAGAQRAGPTGLACPACQERLDRYEAFGIRFEACPACGGIWLHADELRALKDKVGAYESLRWMNEEIDAIENAHGVPTRQACPDCSQARLVATVFGDSGIIIDWCPSCQGIWFDRREFDAVVSHLRVELDRLSPEELKERVGEELDKLLHTPGGQLADLREAGAALGALLNVSIFQHPRLFHLLMAVPPL